VPFIDNFDIMIKKLTNKVELLPKDFKGALVASLLLYVVSLLLCIFSFVIGI